MRAFILIISFIFFAVLHGKTVFGSDRDTARSEWSVEISGGISHHYRRDEGMSPLIFRGITGLAGTGFLQRKENFRHGLLINADYARLRNKRFPENTSRIENFRFEIDHYYLQRLPVEQLNENTTLLIGGNIDILGNLSYHERYGNNAFNYEFAASLNADAAVEHRFALLGRELTFMYRVYLPVYAFYIRPAYASSFSPGFLTGEERSDFSSVMASGKHTSINGFFRWKNRLELNYPIKSGNAIKLGYVWDYYRLNSQHPVYAAVHRLYMGIVVKL